MALQVVPSRGVILLNMTLHVQGWQNALQKSVHTNQHWTVEAMSTDKP